MFAQGVGHTELELGYTCLLFISTLTILHKVVCLKVSEYAITKARFPSRFWCASQNNQILKAKYSVIPLSYYRSGAGIILDTWSCLLLSNLGRAIRPQ